MFDANKESFDQIAVAIEMVIEVARSQSIGSERDNRLSTAASIVATKWSAS